MITIEEVYTYREIYYEHVKPMLKADKSQAEIRAALEYACAEYGMKIDRFHELQAIDLMQRFSGNPRLRVMIGDKEMVHDCVADLPTLRCPRRSEQKD